MSAFIFTMSTSFLGAQIIHLSINYSKVEAVRRGEQNRNAEIS